MRKKFKQLCSGLLSAVMTLSAMPLSAIHAEDDTSDVKYNSSSSIDSDEYYEWKSQVIANQNIVPTKRRSIATNNGIKNDYLELIYENGFYTLGTFEKDSSLSTDNKKQLLFGYPTRASSYTTIRIDNIDYIFNPSIISYTENGISASNVYDDVDVTLNFSFITNQYTGREDVVEFSYSVKNIGTVAHDVGVRIMLDTMLGENDSSPFRIPNIGDISSETDLSGDDVPEFWQSFDSLTKPNVIAQGTIKNNSSTSPDRIKFTNWESAYKNQWDYSILPGSPNGDSAVCIYWNPRNISSGDGYDCKTYYGLSSLQQDGTPPLSVALTGATKLEVEHNDNESASYNPNPFTVTAYIQNIGDGDAQDVTARLNLPSDMSIVEGDEIVDLGDLAVNSSQKQVSWKVWAEPNSVSSKKSYSVTVAAENADAKTIQRNIEIPALQTNGPLKLYFNRNKINNTSDNLELDFRLVNSSNSPVNLSNYIARYYFIDETPDTNKEIERYYCGNQYTDSVNVNVTYNRIPAPYKSNANAYLEFDFSQSNITLNTNDDLRIYYAMHSSNMSSINILNDFSAIDNNYNDEDGLILWTKMPIYEISSGKKVWGTEPKEASEVIVPAMDISCLANTFNNDSIVDMVITLKNTSTTPIYLSNSELTYYYMNDNEYAQNVDIYYAGGRINGDWVSITDKISAEATLLETKKDRANSKIKLSFSSINGALCYNESIDIKLQLSNQNWAQGIFNLENDYSYAGITDTDYLANNIIFTANYLNNNGEYAGYEYGEPIGNYHPTFSAFKIGEGSEEVNTLDDYNNFINYFTSNFGGVPFNEYATGDNISDNDPDSSLDDFVFKNENLTALLASDIAYISGHGSRGGVIPIYPNGIRPNYEFTDETEQDNQCEILYNQILTTDKEVGIDYQNFGIFTASKRYNIDKHIIEDIPDANGNYNKYGFFPQNIFSINMKDHVNENLNENLQWVITGACSQINDKKIKDDPGKYENSISSCDRWKDVLLNNKKMKGVLGYWGRGPSANDTNPDHEIIQEFLRLSAPGGGVNGNPIYNIYDSWIVANQYFKIDNLVKGTSPCGLLVKDSYDRECLYDSLADNKDVKFEKIYRYTAENKAKIFINYSEEVIYPEAISSISEYYNLPLEEVLERIDNNYVEIDRITYNLYGDEEANDIEEYLFSFSQVQNSRSIFAKSRSTVSNDYENNIIIRYNPHTDTVEEFK